MKTFIGELSAASWTYYTPPCPLSRRNLRSGSRILPGESTWCSWAERCWPTSWRTRTTSGWPGRSTRRKESACWKNSESPSDKAPDGQNAHTTHETHIHSTHTFPLSPTSQSIYLFIPLLLCFGSWFSSNIRENWAFTSFYPLLPLCSPGWGLAHTFPHEPQELISSLQISSETLTWLISPNCRVIVALVAHSHWVTVKTTADATCK